MFLDKIIAQYVGYDAVEWLEGWIADVKDPPEPDIIKIFREIRPKRAMKLYRGLAVEGYRTPERLIRSLAGKSLELGDSFDLHSAVFSSWSKDKNSAWSFAMAKYSGGIVTARTKGIVLEATVPPELILVDISKVSGIDRALRQDVVKEKEVIVFPGTVRVRYIMRSKA